MRWVLLVTLGCAFCSVALSAPQDTAVLIKEEKSTDGRSTIPTEKLETVGNTSESRQEPQVTDSESEKPVEVVTEATVPTKKPLAVTKPTQKPPKKPLRVTTVKPVEEVTEATVPTEKPLAVTKPTQKPPKKPLRVTTVKPVEEVSPVTIHDTPSTTANPNRRYPCTCGGGLCSCCSGLLLENFNVPIRSRACANVTYEPDEFAFNFKLLFNNRVLYKTRMSAKNPRPVCIPINRYFGVKMCVKLSNIYMSGRNIHACLDMEGYWDDESAFNYSFNCFRIGSNGVGIVTPEDGGGLPPPPDEEEQTDEDYDDSARGWSGGVEVIPF